ncbi:aspartate dehydrogenase domain-containing protein [Steroidobacter sp.]|uniref:aspartate dehydrogenase domain-containing protein n=1 Tax=Steroidobacter sp. TaxID=1978227 RepID=UPI0032C24B15
MKAALIYPKNVNVALAIALVCVGMDATRVRRVSSRNVTESARADRGTRLVRSFPLEYFRACSGR